jgi:hypothetical protein
MASLFKFAFISVLTSLNIMFVGLLFYELPFLVFLSILIEVAGVLKINTVSSGLVGHSCDLCQANRYAEQLNDAC